MAYQRLGSLKTVEQFRDLLSELNLDLNVDDEPLSEAEGSPLAQPMTIGDVTIGNRWAVNPMEGWDATEDGKPSDLTIRRWQHFGQSGCKLIWGGEAFAVRRDGRANPNQLYYSEDNFDAMQTLYDSLLDAHRERFGENATDDLLVGLQLTHSGRFSRPNDKKKLEPRIAYHNKVLDNRFGIDPEDDSQLLTDKDIQELIGDYVKSAKMAEKIGFQFVDVKHCHGYLGHEFLSAYDRQGPYGGDLEGRTRFMKETVDAIRAECPNLKIGVRVSLFDMIPFIPDPDGSENGKLGAGIPEEYDGQDYPGFGCDRKTPTEIDLSEPIRLLKWMHEELGIFAVNISAGSPYYTPHVERPAFYPPSDGYQPPEDPLVGCYRHIDAVRKVKAAIPDLPLIGSAYSYFQEYLPHVGQAVVRENGVDFVGIGRLILSDWDLPAETLEGKKDRSTKKICRTFSDCTTAPRNGIVSGCYPLDEKFKNSPEHDEVKTAKKEMRERLKNQ